MFEFVIMTVVVDAMGMPVVVKLGLAVVLLSPWHEDDTVRLPYESVFLLLS